MGKRKKVVVRPSTKEDVVEVKKAQEISAVREFINLQKRYKGVYLNRLLTGAEMDEYRKQIEHQRIRIHWNGVPMPRSILACHHDLCQAQYFDLVLEELRLKEDLINNYGVSDESLSILLEQNVYCKDLPKKVESEEDN